MLADPPASIACDGSPSDVLDGHAGPEKKVEKIIDVDDVDLNFNINIGDSSDKVCEAAAKLIAAGGNDIDKISAVAGKIAANSEPPRVQETSNNKPDDEDELWATLEKAGFHFGTHGGKGNPIAGRWQRHLKSNPDENNHMVRLRLDSPREIPGKNGAQRSSRSTGRRRCSRKPFKQLLRTEAATSRCVALRGSMVVEKQG